MASDDWARARDGFDQAVRWFVRCVPEGEGRWEELALGEWSVRDLVGHTSRAMLTVEAYLGTPASEAEVTSAVEYFRRVLASSGDPAAVAQRGRDAGAALGEDPAGAVREISERVLARLHGESGDALLATPAGGMRLADYLPTRTFELTVHTCDLAAALGAPLDVPDLAAVETLEVLVGLASRANLAGPLLLAATGRQPLPAGFSVL
ncbi:MAG: maleylpyruvate isomerase N-terminal domain-containing protein [Actinomycetota bacterium]|nr:maleylpyruvate isomerase N-terminal domain-containing protein [Actinomycetota bacterium]